MTSQVDIYNRVLTKIGSQPVTSVDDTSEACRVLNRCYNSILAAELRCNNWNFAIERVVLAADATAPAYGYDTRYSLPADCLRVIEIDGLSGTNETIGSIGRKEADYTIEQGYILCNETGSLNVRYVKKQTDTSKFDSLFIEGLVCRLAFEVCEAIINNASKKKYYEQEYKGFISDARRVDAIETPPEALYEDDWLLARF